MKKTMIENYDVSQIENEKKLKEFFNDLIYDFEGELDLELYELDHEYGLFKLYCISNTKRIHEAIDELINTMNYILDAYKKNNEYFYNMIKTAIEKRDEALDFFWKYRESSEKYAELSKEKYNFRDKAMLLLDLLNQLIENIIKREAFLINKVNFIMGKSKLNNDIDLNPIIQNLFETPTYNLKEHINDNLKDISINQFRNIVAHSSFKFSNNKIYATYSNNKEIILSIEEVETIYKELYSLRLFIKLCINLSIDFMAMKFPELRKYFRIIPETIIVDINSILKQYGFRIIEYEITDDLCIKEESIKNNGDKTFFILSIECENNKLNEVCVVISEIISEISPMFNEKNNYPDLEKIIWILKLEFKNTERIVCLVMGYDEIKMLNINPLVYANIIESKIRRNVIMNDFFKG